MAPDGSESSDSRSGRLILEENTTSLDVLGKVENPLYLKDKGKTIPVTGREGP
jgi:hypothetical protein